ncbi:Eukaryotic LigT isoform 2 [Hibiscus syriacus]|uniref:Eukaryotic LigT isoform 2 n=1 Tax=Hibiscus syriacus TaxID=106335 RepID=A0A6A3BF78_HIBSY|nr:Eukaryotic LigT isoform 2 [Hibiscus syriacus]
MLQKKRHLDVSFPFCLNSVKIGGAKDNLGTMDKKIRRKGTPVWRSVCTQASSLEEPVIKDVKVESEIGSQMQEVNESTIEVIDATVSPKSLEDDIEDESIKEKAVLSAAKHSLSVELDDIEDESVKEKAVLSAAKHSLSVEVGASVIRFVRGKEGSTKEKIEKETGVQIILPSSKQEDAIKPIGRVVQSSSHCYCVGNSIQHKVIEGTSADSVTKASKVIQHIIDEAVKTPSLDYSHFVSLPLAIHPELVDKLVNFQNSILGIKDTCAVENQEGNSDGDASESDAQGQQFGKGSAVAVELKVADGRESVKVDISGIPLVSYEPKELKESKPSRSSGKQTI